MIRLLITHVVFGLALTAAPFARAATPSFAKPSLATGDLVTANVGLDQLPGAQLPRDIELVAEDGRAVTTGELFGQRPAILTFVYFGCPNLCSLILNDLATALQDVPKMAGRDFDVVIVSIDPSEPPALAAAKKTSLLAIYHKPEAARGWRLLTGRADQVGRLAAASGVRYAYDQETKQYRHPSALITVTPDGHISRYLLGLGFKSNDLQLALAEAEARHIGSVTGTVVDQFLLLCFHYDVTTSRYGPAAMNVVRGAGVAGLVALAWLVRHMIRTPAIKRETPA